MYNGYSIDRPSLRAYAYEYNNLFFFFVYIKQSYIHNNRNANLVPVSNN